MKLLQLPVWGENVTSVGPFEIETETLAGWLLLTGGAVRVQVADPPELLELLEEVEVVLELLELLEEVEVVLELLELLFHPCGYTVMDSVLV